LFIYYGGVVKDDGEGQIRYDGELKKCLTAKEGMGVEELRGLVQ